MRALTASRYGAAGAPIQMTDSQAGTFTATWNPDGNLATQTYPGGITATYIYDPTGTVTSVSYDGAVLERPAHRHHRTPNAAGDWATEAITDTATPLTSTKTYTYDNDDRLTNVQDTLDGECTTRAYTYDADSNRTSLTSYASNIRRHLPRQHRNNQHRDLRQCRPRHQHRLRLRHPRRHHHHPLRRRRRQRQPHRHLLRRRHARQPDPKQRHA